VYSLNVPLPAAVPALARDIAHELPGSRARQRGEHTLGVKRLSHGTDRPYSRLEARAREALAGQSAFTVSVTGVDYFPDAVIGSTPVVYLVVESPELVALHRRLAEVFEPVEGIEGEGYTPHVTVARGGDVSQVRRVVDREIDPIEWTVSELWFWDARQSKSVSTVSLPA
jgi:2'-5' RNA ligase